jgi:phenylacetate-CoA ligase
MIFMVEYWEPLIERMPVDELKAIQEEKLQSLVSYVYNHSTFYKKRFDIAGISPNDIQSLDDVRKLPFTTKQDLRDTYLTGMLCVPQEHVVRYHASSGTTGKPTVVGYTKNDINEWTTSLARGLTSIGVGRGDVVQVGYGYGLFTGGLGLHYGVEMVGASAIPTSSGNTERQIELMQDLGSTAMACTPSYFLYVNEVFNKLGISIVDDTKLKCGLFGAEPWSEEMRRRIEEQTGIKAYDVYGTSEISGPLFTECRYQDGMHIWADQFLIEVIEPDTGERLPDGERGELVVTTLAKEALPLIRYRIGDLTVINSGPCRCGRTHPRIMRILGRTDDMIIIRGINVFPGQVEAVLMDIPEVAEQYLLVVDRVKELDTLTVQVEVTRDVFSNKISDLMVLEKKVIKALQAVLNISANVELMEPGTIPRSTGKAQRIIDKRKI